MTKRIMLMGTGSHVGKSILATALCRIFYQAGQRVTPFKAQNMALNSFVTADGGEMGRAQVAQAEAAGILPNVLMNPVLLKPTGNSSSQVIIMGKPVGTMSAREYHAGYSLTAFEAVKKAAAELCQRYDTVVIEGAGSPAEVNLKANDIVNMRVAKLLNAPVLLIADIDRGGALAALVGTLELLDPDERALVKGLVINKFRGDVSLFDTAVDFLEQKTGKPVLGIVPHIENLGIDDEDSVSLDDNRDNPDGAVRSAVVRLPKIANFTDFSALKAESDVSLVYADSAEELRAADLIILPGSKNTVEDLLHLKQTGLADAIKKLAEAGKPIVGICGGYQMMGQEICDPYKTESSTERVEGLALLPITTVFAREKFTAQALGRCNELRFLGNAITTDDLAGYEIHAGKTTLPTDTGAPFSIKYADGTERAEGCAAANGKIFGTYLHGLFDNNRFRRDFLNALRATKNLPPLAPNYNAAADKEYRYNRLADIVSRHLDLKRLAAIMGGEPLSC